MDENEITVELITQPYKIEQLRKENNQLKEKMNDLTTKFLELNKNILELLKDSTYKHSY